MARPAKATINVAALHHNCALAKRLAPQAHNLAIVKANAYGHGLVEVAQQLVGEVEAFGVTCTEEAVALRESGISLPILLLEGCFAADEWPLVERYKLWVTVGNQYQLDALLAAKLNEAVNVWLKMDTGMHRLGFAPSELTAAYQQLLDSDNVAKKLVFMSHLACGDELNSPKTEQQLTVFNRAVAQLAALAEARGYDYETSLANSAGLMAWPGARRHWNRPGYMLYGGMPFSEPNGDFGTLKPVMTLTTAVIALRSIDTGECVGYGANWCATRPSVIATIAMGYADGYPRVVNANTPVIIDGQRAPIVGNVSMDMITIDVTDLDAVAIGDEVMLWGEGLSIDEVARCANTIGYELIARMPSRVKRIYQTSDSV